MEGRYLVTGGAGFIGSHLVDRLIASGCFVTVLDNFSTGKIENLLGAQRSGRLKIVTGDIRNIAHVRAVSIGMDGIFHQAALVSVPRSLTEPQLSFEINVGGTVNILETSRELGVRRVIFASSAAVYGESSAPLHEERTPERPLTPYGLDKLTAEKYAAFYAYQYGLEVVALRYFNVFGRRQDSSSPYSGVISIFADRLKHGVGVTIYGDGEQTRDFVHVYDVVDANIAAMTTGLTSFAVCNIGSGRETSINQLVTLLRGMVGSVSSVDQQPARAGDIRRSCPDITRAREFLGYKPHYDFATGLRELIAH